MSVVSLLGVRVLQNPTKFSDPYEFEITFECLEPLQKDLEWKLIYVGSATSSDHDQELDSLLVGPIPVGVNKFIFEADPPKLAQIPTSEILGVTVILLTCSYDNREFVRVGYYVNNEYDSEELTAEPPAKPIIERVRRNILAEKPRVTRFAIKWDSEESAPAEFPPEQPEADAADDDADKYGAEEVELEQALIQEEAALAAAEDADMAGGEDTAGPAASAKAEVADTSAAAEGDEADDASDAGSEDLEADSSGSEDEEGDEEEGEAEGEGEGEAEAEVEGEGEGEGEGDADEDMEMGDDAANKGADADTSTTTKQRLDAQPEVMVH